MEKSTVAKPIPGRKRKISMEEISADVENILTIINMSVQSVLV